jgi:hypothetical protein
LTPFIRGCSLVTGTSMYYEGMSMSEFRVRSSSVLFQDQKSDTVYGVQNISYTGAECYVCPCYTVHTYLYFYCSIYPVDNFKYLAFTSIQYICMTTWNYGYTYQVLLEPKRVSGGIPKNRSFEVYEY